MSKLQKPQAIDFAIATQDELDQHGMEMLVSGSPGLTSILHGHLLIERAIETLIANKLTRPRKLFDNHHLTFEMKIDLADAMGLLPAAYVGAVKALNNIRNSYAHNEDYKISIDDLVPLKIKWAPNQKKAFAAAVAKGPAEATQIAVIFLNWSFLRFLHSI